MGARGRPRRTMGGSGWSLSSGNAREAKDQSGSQGFHPEGARGAKDHSSRNGSRGFGLTGRTSVGERHRDATSHDLCDGTRGARSSRRCQKRTNEKEQAVLSKSRQLRGARIPRSGRERCAQTVRRSEGARRAHPLPWSRLVRVGCAGSRGSSTMSGTRRFRDRHPPEEEALRPLMIRSPITDSMFFTEHCSYDVKALARAAPSVPDRDAVHRAPCCVRDRNPGHAR